MPEHNIKILLSLPNSIWKEKKRDDHIVFTIPSLYVISPSVYGGLKISVNFLF